MNWWKNSKIKVKAQEALSRYTTFRIGGPADYFIEPKGIADLKSLLKLAKRYKIPILVLGAGSNILVNDHGVKAAVLRLNSPYFKRISFKGCFMDIGSGVKLSQIIQVSQRQGLSGTEFLAGIPATVGGALMMNAAAYDRSIADIVEKVSVMDYRGNVRTLNKKEIEFSYRRSNLAKYIVLGARIKLRKNNKKGIKKKIGQYINCRRLSQDLSYPSAGCIFKNPSGHSAGRLIDLCGLKGKQIGGACISRKHANFIVNLGKAQAKDVLRLMDLTRKEVKHKFNITLKPEIKIWQ